MDVGRGIGAPFKDQAWATKALIGGVWAVVPFTGFALTGFYLDYIRNTAHGRETPLPDWGLFGRFWVRGFLASIAIMVYLLPAIAIVLFGVLSLVPVRVMTDWEHMSGPSGLEGLFAGGLCLAVMVAIIYTFAVWIFAAAALTHYAMHEEFGTAFAFGEIKRRLSTPGASYSTALVMSIVIAIVAGVVSSTVTTVLFVIPVLGWIAGIFVGGAISFIGSLMAAHLFGQYAAVAYSLPGPAGAPPAYVPPSATAPPASAPQAPQAPEPPAAPEPPVVPPPAESPTEPEHAAGAETEPGEPEGPLAGSGEESDER